MQPDPLSTPQEEKQPEPIPPKPEAQPPVPLYAQPQAQPAPSPAPQVVRHAPAPVVQKKPSRWGAISAIVLGLLVIFLLVVAAGLGFWAYSLNTRLASAQQQLAALQAEHDKLQTDHTTLVSDHEKMNTDLTQTKADLEKANADLATAQADLKKAQDQNEALSTKISKASKLANILHSWFISDNNKVDFIGITLQVKEVNDAKLSALWAKYVTSGTKSDITELFNYLITVLRDSLK